MRLVFDIETNGLFPKVDTIHCICALDVDTGEQYRANSQDPSGLPSMVKRLEDASLLIGHNIVDYDIPVLEKVVGPVSLPEDLYDTKLASKIAYPHLQQLDYASTRGRDIPSRFKGSHSLKWWGVRLGLHKGDFGEDTDWSEWSQAMEDYCMQDVLVTSKLYKHLLTRPIPEDALDLEQRLQAIISQQERHGFLFDQAKAEALYVRLNQRKKELLEHMAREFPAKVIPGRPYKNNPNRHTKTKVIPFNPGSNKQIAERFIARGWEPTSFTPTKQPKLDEENLQSLADQFGAAEPLVEYAMVQKRLGQIGNGPSAWLKKVGPDGRVHGGADTMGTATFRFTHMNPNMGQVPSVKKPYGKECRELWTVASGHKLVGCDVSGLELRILAHYLSKWDGGSYRDQILEGDIHSANQQAAGLESRDQAKTLIYAFLYGAGDKKLGKIVGGGVAEGKALRSRFLKKVPALRKLLTYTRQESSKRKKLATLDGRYVYIRSPHSALNFLIQSAGSILVKRATVKFREIMESEYGLFMGKDWSLVVHVHDEWQMEVRQQWADLAAQEAVRAVEWAGDYYNLQCPTTAEAKIGNNWAETH